MNSSAHLWLAASSPGYCEKTDNRGDCTSGDKGAFGLAAEHKTWPSAVRACLDICAGCPRCRHISVSPQFSDCSWFSTCKTLSTADVPPSSFRSAPARRPSRRRRRAARLRVRRRAGSARPPLAIATVLMLANSSSSVRSSCGLVKYCFAAGRLASLEYLSGHLETVVLTNAPAYVRSLCRATPRPRVLRLDGRLERAIATHRAALDRAAPLSADDDGRARTVAMAGLARWQLVALTEYTAILCVDLDVDLFLYTGGVPPAAGTVEAEVLEHAVTAALGAFLNDTQIELVARADFHSPINLGVVWLKPSKATHDLGMRVLEAGTFDPELGWERVGSPRRAVALDRLPPAVRHRVRADFLASRTIMLRDDSWKFVSAEGDQGLFAYVYLVLKGAQTLSSSGDAAPWGRGWPLGQRWIVHHLFYAHKPWAPWARCGPYFDFLSQPGVELDERTTCAAILAEKRRCLARNIGASLPPAQCEACGRGEVQAHMRDDESRAQLHWACKQTTQCHQDHDREWIEWAVL